MRTQQATCIVTDLWEVTTIEMHNTLVSAKTIEQAKTKVNKYLQGNCENFVWPQHTRIKDNVNLFTKQ